MIVNVLNSKDINEDLVWDISEDGYRFDMSDVKVKLICLDTDDEIKNEIILNEKLDSNVGDD